MVHTGIYTCTYVVIATITVEITVVHAYTVADTTTPPCAPL